MPRDQIPVPASVGASGVLGWEKRASGNQELQPTRLSGWYPVVLENPGWLYGTNQFSKLFTSIPLTGVATGRHVIELTMNCAGISPYKAFITFRISNGAIAFAYAYTLAPQLGANVSFGVGSSNGFVAISWSDNCSTCWLSIQYQAMLLPYDATGLTLGPANNSGIEAFLNGWYTTSNNGAGFTACTQGIILSGSLTATSVSATLGATVTGAASSFGTAAAPQLLQVNGYETTGLLATSLARTFG